jgi:hypothetical protein
MSRNIEFSDGPQEAKALANANKMLGNSANKLLYILVTEDPSNKTQVRYFATAKVDKLATYVDLVGYEVTNAQSNKLKTWDDVTELAKKGKLEILNISFPWQRVINIRNVSYKIKSV